MQWENEDFENILPRAMNILIALKQYGSKLLPITECSTQWLVTKCLSLFNCQFCCVASSIFIYNCHSNNPSALNQIWFHAGNTEALKMLSSNED